MGLIWGLLLLLDPMARAVGAAETFDLEDILGVSYPTQLATAAATDRVTWVLNESGARNVWTAAPGDGPRRLTAYIGDDGQPLGGLALTPDGRLVVYVRGGSENQAGVLEKALAAPR